ncbi:MULTISPECIES: AI-2E family transporter [Novosphingobium]|jgi:predicted PurR-regulated permease PerM|uniref:Predicted PurR-regulated permease PerM n=1 Tax=Novosphingobium panipatense TaxID=428991 RepID=A0ABY1PXM8_9SPHN|nr:MULTISPECIES: AI-2E family transporter [Novosphingobium]SMP52135.1 Predicted PurR-regulated permease PerM [Novosphingobium panipatense]
MGSQEKSGFETEDIGFTVLVVLISLAAAYLLAPYFGPVLWGVVAAIMFQPLTARLATRLDGRKNLAASIVLFGLITLLVVPTILLGISLVNEATMLYEKIASGQIDFGRIFQQVMSALPRRARELLSEYDLTNFETIRREFGSSITSGLQTIAGRVLTVGQGALSFIAALGVMLYLSYFLLRDGDRYGEKFRTCLPLRPATRDALIENFLLVVRATMRGTVVVAVVQGFLGGILFSSLGIEGALIWGVLMGFFSLLPAVGTAIIWGPVAIYLFAAGEPMKAGIVLFCGVFIIGMVDNVLRPILVGRDTRLPDFVVLIATLSGLELFGLNGFIIGPVIAALFIAVWNHHRDSRRAREEVLTGSPVPVQTDAVASRAVEESVAHPS